MISRNNCDVCSLPAIVRCVWGTDIEDKDNTTTEDLCSDCYGELLAFLEKRENRPYFAIPKFYNE